MGITANGFVFSKNSLMPICILFLCISLAGWSCNNVEEPGGNILIPDPPSALSLSSVSSNEIALSWIDTSDNEDGFSIERAPEEGGNAGVYEIIHTVSSDEISFNDYGLEVNKEYFYRIRAYNSIGNSDYSNQVSCKTMIPGWNFDQFTDMEKEYGSTDTNILQHYPSLQEILNKPAQDIPVYGLYTWSSSWGAWWHWYDEISQVGWRTIRVAGIRDLDDEEMEYLIIYNVEPMFTLFGNLVHTYRGDYGIIPDVDLDNEFINDFLDLIDDRIGRYGPMGSFFVDNPDPEFQPGGDKYKPVIYWEIWNEPNLHYLLGAEHWDALDKEGKADLYARLLIASYDHIRANPEWNDVKVVGISSCGVSAENAFNDGVGWKKSFVQLVHEKLVEHGGHANYYDILSTHPYTHDVGPDTEHLLESYQYSLVNSYAEIRESMESFGNTDKPVWYTEVGWHRDVGAFAADVKPYPVTERQQAAYVTRLYLTAMRLGVERVHVMFVNDADNFNGGFFNNEDCSWWEQTYAVQNMITIMPKPKLIEVVNDGGYGDNDLSDSEGYYAYIYDPNTDVSGDTTVIVAWNVEGPITVEIPCDPGEYRVINMLGDYEDIITSSMLPIEIGPCP
ncbi:MAG: fibronectin type III domain-containing protein, partial [Spirochaetota bacterium]|nr:fibronectin type III domain-containing protein [Spirochaetota bacterium]